MKKTRGGKRVESGKWKVESGEWKVLNAIAGFMTLDFHHI
jgi:hypothetical protein